MKKSKFVKSTIILIIGGFITKILGMLIKIVMTRLIGTEGIGLYMMISPTFMLLITIAQLGFPVAISKLVAEDKGNNKNIVFSILPVSIIINIIIIIFLLFFSEFLSTNLLKDPNLKTPLLCVGLVLPFISISSILRSYFFGKQKMLPHVVSNITEDIIRLITLLLGIPIFIQKGIYSAISFIVLSNILSEITSIIVLFIFLPKNFSLKKEDIIPNKQNIKNIFNISIPSTGSRILGNIAYFFEPIIVTNILLKIGYTNNFIVTEYGIINGYVMPLLMLPSFFTLAISQALLPVVSNSYCNNELNYTKKKIRQAIFFSLIIGIPATIIFMIFPEFLLKTIYNTNEGITYIRFLAPIFILHYIQSPLTSSLQAMNKAKCAMMGTLIGIIIKTGALIIFLNLRIGLWGLIIATSLGTIYITLHHIYYTKKYLKN